MQKSDEVRREPRDLPSDSPNSFGQYTSIVITVILSILFGLGGYVMGVRQQPSLAPSLPAKTESDRFPTTTSVQQLFPTGSQTDLIAGWQIYRDTTYEYQFKFPAKWVANVCGSTVLFTDLSTSCATEPLGHIVVDVRNAKRPLPDFVNYEQSSWEVERLQEITVDGLKAVKALLKKNEPAPGPDRFLVVRLIENRDEFTITFYDLEGIEIIDQILSTFRFLR